MTRILTPLQLGEALAELLDYEALELLRCAEENPRHLFIPYLLNDAVEQYLVLEECRVIGEVPPEFPPDTTVELTEEELPGVILRLPGGQVVTLWYRAARLERRLYQYHAIGHFWRQGQEQWRQLVYAVGTARDKQLYLDTALCTPDEAALARLAHFGPFRYWSPIRESLEERYPDSAEGIACMEELAAQAGDRGYLRLVRLYRCLPRPLRRAAVRPLALALTRPERKELYLLIRSRLEQASLTYPAREYPPARAAAMEQARQTVTRRLYALGYTGEYPCFIKGCTQAIAMEEHPFCIQSMDYEGFEFGIRLMVSATARPDARPNAGFFEGTGRICTLEEMES